MQREELLTEVSSTLKELKSKEFIMKVKEALKTGIPAYEIVQEGIVRGMDVVGKRFEKCVYFLPELLVAGNITKQAMELLEPELQKSGVEDSQFRVIIGSVRYDLHDIGKDIVASMLRGNGFKVIDLGVDVPKEVFVKKVRELKPDILALSATLSSVMESMEETIHAIEEAGLRKHVKILVGGTPITEEWAKKIGADGFGKDAREAVVKAKMLVRAD